LNSPFWNPIAPESTFTLPVLATLPGALPIQPIGCRYRQLPTSQKLAILAKNSESPYQISR
jgi:hypothetical protein